MLICVPQLLRARPAVLLSDNGQQPRFEGVQIDLVESTAFFRIPLKLPLTSSERTVHWFVDLGEQAASSKRLRLFRGESLQNDEADVVRCCAS